MANHKEKNESGEASVVPTGSVRPFEEQSELERVLWARRSMHASFLNSVPERIKQAVKKQDYKSAAAIREKEIKSKGELEDVDHLIELYEEEFRRR